MKRRKPVLQQLEVLVMRYHRFFLTLGQMIVIVGSLTAAFLLRFDLTLPDTEGKLLLAGIAIAVPLKMLIFILGGLNYGWTRYAGLPDLCRVGTTNLAASLAFTSVVRPLLGPSFPRSVYLIDLLLCFVVMSALRFALRLYNEIVVPGLPKPGRKRLLIYGAGATGIALYRELRANPSLGYDVVGFIDDDPRKRNAKFLGGAVLGSSRSLVHIDNHRRKNRIDEVIIAMPSATGRQMRETVANCRAAGIPCKIMPGIAERMNGRALSRNIRSIEIKDLLGREPVHLDEVSIRRHLTNRSVLVTGGAGSIGSELCRQIAGFDVRRIVILDQAESDLFRIDNELRERQLDVELIPEIATIRDPQRLSQLIDKYEIDAIFHAAAYKHVPMMELHVREAVENNILGTWNVVQAAYTHRIRDLLMISSDKAVNPTSIMGVTKRISELIVAARASDGGTRRARWVSVRFGNVLGSNGSVVPIFRAQILAGGPVTVTHPDMRRYFMTIREAVQLVLQASTMGHTADIFVLDMGEPVRIVDLAKNMIRLSGLEPGEDIDIRFTGMRPGEKLFEEICVAGEHIQETYHDKIKIFRGPLVEQREIEQWIADLRGMLGRANNDELIEHLRLLVPEYGVRQDSEALQANAVGV